LIATDLGEPADEALRQGDAWARRIGARVDVCHVIPDLVRIQPLFPQLNIEDALAVPRLRERVIDMLVERVRQVIGRTETDCDFIVEEGSAAARVVEMADRVAAELVVVGATGKQPLERALLGSNAEQIVRHAHRSVLVARRSPDSGLVLAATDLSDRAETAVAAAAAEASRREGRLGLVHCIDIGRPPLASIEGSAVLPGATLGALRAACREGLARAMERFGARGEMIVTEGPPRTAIAAAARDVGTELLVVGTHGRTDFRRLALGSVAQALVRSAACSVLVVRAGSEA